MDTITVLQMARAARVDLNQVYHWIWLDKLPARKVGGKWFILCEDADRFLNERNTRRGPGEGGGE